MDKIDGMLSYSISLLEERAYLKGINIRIVDMHYDISIGEYKLEYAER